MRKAKYLTTFFFVLVICSQLILQLLGINFNSEKFENRGALKKPTFSIESMKKATSISPFIIAFYTEVFNYRNTFYHYFTGNFRMKENLIGVYRFIQKDLLGQSAFPQKVVMGKDGWMFLGNGYSNALLESLGILTWEEGEKEAIRKRLVSIKKWCKNRNIQLYISVAPNKHTIHSAYLPIEKSSNTNKVKSLKSFLANHQINLIDLSETLINHNHKELYFKGDSHWNELGAFLGYKHLITEIEKDFSEIKGLELTDFMLSNESIQGNDLYQLVLDTTRLKSVKMNPKNPAKGKLVPKKIKISPYLNYENRYQSNSNKLKVITFCDSFSSNMRPYLKENFGEIVFIRDMRFDTKLISQEKPDIIIIEIVEREIDVLKDL